MHELLFAGKASPGGAAWQRLLGALLLVLGGTFAGMTVWANGQTGGTGVVPAEGLRLWLRADKGVVLNSNGEVWQWLDQSGLGNDAENTLLVTSTTSPGLVPIATGVLLENDPALGAVLRASGAYDSYGLNIPAFSSGGTVGGEIFAVLKADSFTIGSPFHIGSQYFGYPSWASSAYRRGVISDNLGISSGIQMEVPSSVPIYDHWRIYNVSAAESGWGAWLNNQRIGSSIGAVYPIGGGSGYIGYSEWQGRIAELIVYNRALENDEADSVLRYLNQKYVLNIAGVEPVAFDFWDDGDTDGDGIPDYWESFFGSNPFRADEWSDPGDTGHTVAERFAALNNGESDPVSGLKPVTLASLIASGAAVATRQDSDKDGVTDHREAQLGYVPGDKNNTPPVPRYAIIDLGLVSDVDEKPVAVSEENGWIVSSKGYRWHLQDGTTPALLEDFGEIDLHEGVYFERPADFGPLYGIPHISDINNDGAVLPRGYICSRHPSSGEYYASKFEEVWKAGIVPSHGLSGYYWKGLP